MLVKAEVLSENIRIVVVSIARFHRAMMHGTRDLAAHPPTAKSKNQTSPSPDPDLYYISL